MCARTADSVLPTAKVQPQSKSLSRAVIEKEIQRLLDVFFESGDKSHGAGKCPFCRIGDLAAMRLTDPQNLNKGGVWCNKCNFKIMM